MKVWGLIPGLDGGPRKAIVVRRLRRGRFGDLLAVRSSTGLFMAVEAGDLVERIWGEGGSALERQVLAEAGYAIEWRGEPKTPAPVPAGRRGRR